MSRAPSGNRGGDTPREAWHALRQVFFISPFKYGVPSDSDLLFDVRFLPNPNYVPGCRHLSGKHLKVVRYVRSFPQTGEFIGRISDLSIYLIPHYAREGKSNLTISFGCTGGRHRSVMIAEAIGRNLAAAGCTTKIVHRDIHKKD